MRIAPVTLKKGSKVHTDPAPVQEHAEDDRQRETQDGSEQLGPDGSAFDGGSLGRGEQEQRGLHAFTQDGEERQRRQRERSGHER